LFLAHGLVLVKKNRSRWETRKKRWSLLVLLGYFLHGNMNGDLIKMVNVFVSVTDLNHIAYNTFKS